VAVGIGLAGIVLGSSITVDAALELATILAVAPVLVGTVLLASLTSVPNAYAAVRLAREYRGAAVVSTALNSNTLNLLCGVAIPSVVVATVGSAGMLLNLAWLAAMTLLVFGLLYRRTGLRRWGGVGIVGLYGCFVVFQLVVSLASGT
jgi:cation:H+ antiporter